MIADHPFQRFLSEGTDEAFREIVSRHAALVLATAKRVTNGDTALAEDIAQEVFIHLARKASQLPRDVVLAGWLYRHTYYTATKAVRSESRRRLREATAAEGIQPNIAMTPNSESTTDTASSWATIEPLIDRVLDQLKTKDRDAIVLRYLESCSLQTVGDALGVSEGAAQKRIARALERMRTLLQQHGVSLSVAAITTVLSEHAAAKSVSSAVITQFADGAVSHLFSTGKLAGGLGVFKAILLGCAVSFAIGGALLAWQHDQMKRLQAGVLTKFEEPINPHQVSQAEISLTRTGRNTTSPEPSKFLEELRLLASQPKTERLKETIIELLAMVPDEALPELAKGFQDDPVTDRFWYYVLPLLLDRWGPVNTMEALDTCVGKNLNAQFADSLRSWKTGDWVLAQNWFLQWVQRDEAADSKKSDIKDAAVWIALKDAKQFETFLQSLETLPESAAKLVQGARGTAIDRMGYSGTDGLESFYEHITDKEIETGLVKELFWKASRAHEEDFNHVATQMVWALNALPAEQHHSFILSAFPRWANDPGAIDWLKEAVDATWWDSIVRESSVRWADREVGMQIASNLVDPDERALVLAGLYREWVRSDAEKAAQYLQRNPPQSARLHEILAEESQ